MRKIENLSTWKTTGTVVTGATTNASCANCAPSNMLLPVDTTQKHVSLSVVGFLRAHLWQRQLKILEESQSHRLQTMSTPPRMVSTPSTVVRHISSATTLIPGTPGMAGAANLLPPPTLLPLPSTLPPTAYEKLSGNARWQEVQPTATNKLAAA